MLPPRDQLEMAGHRIIRTMRNVRTRRKELLDDVLEYRGHDLAAANACRIQKACGAAYFKTHDRDAWVAAQEAHYAEMERLRRSFDEYVHLGESLEALERELSFMQSALRGSE
jgi:uncharacterized coiled-coil DUF342 family protein